MTMIVVSSHRGHFTAFFGTLTAGFRADAAMIHAFGRVFGALFGAGVAKVRAKLAIGLGEVSVQLHHDNCRIAGSRAFEVQANTCSQIVDVVFFQAGLCALMAYCRAVRAGIYTIPIF
jgi:hypothetical protein